MPEAAAAAAPGAALQDGVLQKKVDGRLLALIKRAVTAHQRGFLVLVGDRGYYQVPTFHEVLSKLTSSNPSVLWCYESELLYLSHDEKRKRQVKRRVASGRWEAVADVPFTEFLERTAGNRRQCKYKQTASVLGRTFKMAVLQDFESLTPNLLCRVIETVEGGGLIVLLLRTMASLRQLYTVTMGFHRNLCSEGFRASGQQLKPRFNQRFILSLAKCQNCLLLDDELNVLPLSSRQVGGFAPAGEPAASGPDEEKVPVSVSDARAAARAARGNFSLHVSSLEPAMRALLAQETGVVARLMSLCATCDQARAVSRFVHAVQTRASNTTVALTAARGRGKSAALGLVLAAAVASGYSRLLLTAPYADNVATVFEFLCVGLVTLGFEETADFRVLTAEQQPSSADGRRGRNLFPVRVEIQRRRPDKNDDDEEDGSTLSSVLQIVQYLPPEECVAAVESHAAEIVVVDEAAAIPLPLVKQLVRGNAFAFLSSTVSGYEGTGRALSLKLFKELASAKKRTFIRTDLKAPIRYAEHDPIERWLNRLLCLTAVDAYPLPREAADLRAEDCRLYEVCRDTLFACQSNPESFSTDAFLRRVVGLFVNSHYRNSPDDLLKLADAPMHRLFVLLGPSREKKVERSSSLDSDGEVADEDSNPLLPSVLAAVQVVLEGNVGTRTGGTLSGDQVPHRLSEEFSESFGYLKGARVFRLAVHPKLQGKGFGSHALRSLIHFFERDETDENVPLPNLQPEEPAAPRKRTRTPEKEEENQGEDFRKKLQEEDVESLQNVDSVLPPLVQDCCDSKPGVRVNYLSSSFGLTKELLRFWSRAGFAPVRLAAQRQVETGEHSVIVLRPLHASAAAEQPEQLRWFSARFRVNFVDSMPAYYKALSPSLCATVILHTETTGLSLDYTPITQCRKILGYALSARDLIELEEVACRKLPWVQRRGLLARVCRHLLSGQIPELLPLDHREAGPKAKPLATSKAYLLATACSLVRFDDAERLAESDVIDLSELLCAALQNVPAN